MRKRAEELLIEGHRDRQVVALLERLASESEDASEMALFAHRQLAELRLETSPWQAALHLRRLTEAGVQDDGVYALLGLCHALMGNFRTAVSAYRRALRTAAHNPWYHHNLGHLLDVGLGDARSALFHLREAHRLEPDEDEVTASLAHCLARLGELDEARVLATRAVTRAVGNQEHEALLRWIENGAHDSKRVSPRRAHVRPGGSVGSRPPNEPSKRQAKQSRQGGGRPTASPPPESDAAHVTGHEAELGHASARDPMGNDVEALLRALMPDAGFSSAEVSGAVALCWDYQNASGVRQAKPDVVAAAVEYAYGRLMGRQLTQSGVAKRYGVGAGSISSRYRLIQDVLKLEHLDPRYARQD